MMNKATLQAKLQFICNQQVGLELFFLYRQKSDDPIQILRANLEGSSALNKLESVFINKVKSQFFNQDTEGKSINNSIEWDLKHIKDVNELKNTYYYFPNEESENEDYHIPEAFKEMETLKNKDYNSIEAFEFEKHLLDDVFALLIRLQIDSEQVIFFKHKYPIDVLSRSTVLKVKNIKLLNHDTKFSLEQEPLLKISDKIDFIYINNSFIILNLQLLESKYGFNERYLKKGTESLEYIKNKNILFNTDKLDELAKTVSFSKKLMRVKADNEVLKTPIADMKKFLEEYKTKDGNYSLAKRIKFVPSKNKFEVKTKVAAEDFIMLLNDQFLISLLTKKPYISEAQSEFEVQEEKPKGKTKSGKNKLEKIKEP